MTAATFRRLANALPDAVEGCHQNHADFRSGGKIFATLGYPDKRHGMIKLAPEEQALLMKSRPNAYSPAAGAWGTNGATLVTLAAATEASVRKVLILAHKKVWKDIPRPR